MPEGMPILARLKLAVIKRDNCSCQICGKEGIYTDHYGPRVIEKLNERIYDYDGKYYEKEIAFEFDHIFPRNSGGKNALDNLQLLCRKCNKKKGAKIA